MDKKILFLILVVFAACIIPIVYAETIQDSIDQQILQNSISSQDYKISFDPQTSISDYINSNPKIKAAFVKIGIFIIIISILIIIDLILRGFAMWRASKNDSKIWFWALLIINSLGILPIIYLLISKKPANKKKARK